MSVDDAHTRPTGTSDATVAALGKLSEAFEGVEDARGQLYDFHRKCGTADLADRIDTDLVGRNILAGRWSFQVVEEYDDGYYAAFKRHEKAARDELMDGKRHVFEAEMKQDRRTHGRPGHEATPHGETP